MTQRTAEGLRETLFETLDGLRDGSISASRARAICDVSARIMDTVRMEINEARVVRKFIELERQMLPPAPDDA